MTKDERLMQAIKRIKVQSEMWIDQVNDIGNQCAYTDRGLENILDLSKELDEIYNGKPKVIDVQERINTIKAMEWIARCLNSEDIFMEWLMAGVADGDCDWNDNNPERLSYYYEDDDVFADLMGLFLWMMHKAYKGKSGLYVDNVLSTEENYE